MKDEEKRIFEEWFEEKKEKCEVYGNGDDFWVDDEIKKFCLMGYELGLKAGRPQWHTPDARLPEEEGDYLFCLRDGEETMYDIVGVSIDGNGYVSLDSHIWSITDVIAWTELPTFDKE